MHVPVNGSLIAVEITGPVLVDAEGTAAMADTLTRTHPLATRRCQLDNLPVGIRVSTDPYRTMTNLRLPHAEHGQPLEALGRDLKGSSGSLRPSRRTPG